MNIMNRILIMLAGIASLLAAVLGYRGNFFKEKAKSAEKRADTAEEIIEDVEMVNRAINDSDERDRVSKKYTSEN